MLFFSNLGNFEALIKHLTKYSELSSCPVLFKVVIFLPPAYFFRLLILYLVFFFVFGHKAVGSAVMA